MVNKLYVFLRGLYLVYKFIITAPHCFFKMFYSGLGHLSFSMMQQFLSRLTKIRSRRPLFIWSEKSLLSFNLFTAYTQKKSNHKKYHASLFDSQYLRCLLKKYSRLQHLSQSGYPQACKTSDFFFWSILLVSSPPLVNQRSLGQSETLFGLIKYIFRTINLINFKFTMKKQWTHLLKLQEVGDKNIFCFYGNRAKPLLVSLSHLPHLPWQSETSKNGEAKTMIVR